MSEEGTKNLSGSDHNFATILINSYPILGAKFNGNFLINDNFSALRKVINLYISFNLHAWSRYLNTKFTLVYCLFEAMRMTKASDPDKYGYSGYGTDSMNVHNFHYQTVAGIKISFVLGLILVLLCMLIIKIIIS